jgi:hypothetical protein
MPQRNRIRTACLPIIESMESRMLLSTYLVTNTNDSGSGSLRQAILDANKSSNQDTIQFKIGSGQKTISPHSALPMISQPVTIDGTSQPGFSGKPLIELSGSSAGSGRDGLKIMSTNVTVKGLIVNRFGGSGIFLYMKGNDHITGNWIGVNNSGTGAAPNGGHGIIVQSPANTIGGTSASERNVISGNKQDGVMFYTNAATRNTILGNYIGTDYTGSHAIANHNGVHVYGGTSTMIGGTSSGARNVISGNVYDGVVINNTGASYNTVQGNYVGTNAAGTGRLGNGTYGVEVSQPHNTVGGTTSSARNIISANGEDGVSFYLSSGNNNVCQGNFIGTDYTGTRDLGNNSAGISITNDAYNNVVGGSGGAGNVIAGNELYGIGIYNHSTYNTVDHNRIGFGANGQAVVNTKSPVSIWISDHNTLKYNDIAANGAVSAIMISSGLTTTLTSNSIGKISSTSSSTTTTPTQPTSTLSIGGEVWNDANGNGSFNSGESGKSGVKIYLDLNKNGSLDSSEPSTYTNSSGVYKFSGLAKLPSGQTYRIRIVNPSGYRDTNPSSGYLDTVGGWLNKNFGIHATGSTPQSVQTLSIGGKVWNDWNANGQLNVGESGRNGVKVYLDLNKNGRLDAGENVAYTNSSGVYRFDGLPKLPSGQTYRIRIETPFDYRNSNPSNGYLDTVGGWLNKDFGVTPA